MPKTRKTFYELDDIRDDLESLKSNVIELTHHIQENGVAASLELSKTAQKSLQDLQARGTRELHKIERRIKTKPAQSLAIAFAAGLAASYLIGRRR